MSDPSSTERREVVFIVGGHGGIGTALSLRLAARGATIVLAGRDGTAVRAAVETEAMHPLGRLGEPDDVASLLAWLVDPQVSWITGQVFGVDGGLATVRSR